MDTKAKVPLGDYARGGKNQDDGNGQVTKGWITIRPPRRNRSLRHPDGGRGSVDLVVRVAGDQRRLAHALQMRGEHVRAFDGHIKRLVIYWTPVQETRVGGPSFSSGWWSLPTGRGWSYAWRTIRPAIARQSDRTLLVGPGEEMERCDLNCLRRFWNAPCG